MRKMLNMISILIRRLIKIRSFSAALLKPALKLHTMFYKLASMMAIQLNSGVHPKHRIMQYKEWFLRHVEDGHIVLDVGCNTGTMTRVMSQKAALVYGLEVEEEHINIAQNTEHRDNIKYICADATTYNYSECDPIDLITLSNVLEHIEHRVDFLKRLVNQVPWKKASNRKILIRVPALDREWIVVYKKELGIEYRLDNTHFIEYTFEQFERELEESGVKILSHQVKFGEIYAVCRVL